MLTEGQQLSYDLNGYVLLPKVLSDAECAELLAIARRLPVDDRLASARQVVLPNPAWTERRILELSMERRLRGVAESVIGGESRLEETQFLLFPADGPTASVDSPALCDARWHRGLSPDYGSFESGGHYHCLLAKVLVYLSPGNDSTGVIPGSHRQTIAVGDFSRLAMPGMCARVTATRGDALLFGETLIHSSPPRPYVTDRALLVLAYAAPFMRSWSRETAPPDRLSYALSESERRFVYGEARYEFRDEFL